MPGLAQSVELLTAEWGDHGFDLWGRTNSQVVTDFQPQNGKKCDILNQELVKVVRNGLKVVRCVKFPSGRTSSGEYTYGYWKSHVTLKLEQ